MLDRTLRRVLAAAPHPELVHVRGPERNRTRGAQAGHAGRIEGRTVALENTARGVEHLPLDSQIRLHEKRDIFEATLCR
jgi:hypothetical protein